MYRIKLVRQNFGSKRACKPRYSEECWQTFAEAQAGMNRLIQKQEQSIWQQCGLVDIRREFVNNGIALNVYPALRMINGCRLVFTIVEVE